MSSIALLLQAGAAANERDAGDHDTSALLTACAYDQLDAARALLDAGAQNNDHDAEGESALHWAVFAAAPSRYEELGEMHTSTMIAKTEAPLVKLLLARGARTDVVDHDRNTPLHHAVLMDARVAAELLVAAGSDRHAVNRDGKTAYDLAVAHSRDFADVVKPARK